MGIKWWYWVLLCLGLVLIIGAVVYGVTFGQLGG